jgi:hypothetical protein
MKLSDVLNILSDIDLEDNLEGISYDGEPDSFKLDISYNDITNDDMYFFEVHLLPGGEIFFSIIEGEDEKWSYTPIEIIHIVSEIEKVWKNNTKD